jgi:hypothetical protein
VPVKPARLLLDISKVVVLIRIRESIAFSKTQYFATDLWRTLYLKKYQTGGLEDYPLTDTTRNEKLLVDI